MLGHFLASATGAARGERRELSRCSPAVLIAFLAFLAVGTVLLQQLGAGRSFEMPSRHMIIFFGRGREKDIHNTQKNVVMHARSIDYKTVAIFIIKLFPLFECQ